MYSVDRRSSIDLEWRATKHFYMRVHDNVPSSEYWLKIPHQPKLLNLNRFSRMHSAIHICRLVTIHSTKSVPLQLLSCSFGPGPYVWTGSLQSRRPCTNIRWEVTRYVVSNGNSEKKFVLTFNFSALQNYLSKPSSLPLVIRRSVLARSS
ncbi:hypothetical protein L218DRAFT_268083 [Marasmius fiardii PR-910]|nr:hypothetical protein L218DRAFT_268083 [Marasmius fiardii PR-910]